MVWIDIVIIIIIIWFTYKGFRNGFIIEVTTLIAIIFSIWGALKYENFTTKLLQDYLNWQGNYIPFVSFIVNFLLIFILIVIIGKILTKVFNFVHLGIINRILGSLFGLIKIMIILCFIINGIDRINHSTKFINQKTINESFLYQPLNSLSEKIYKIYNSDFDKLKKIYIK